MDRLVNTEYSDNRFEQMGVALQMDANSWQAAKQAYEQTCLLCCSKGVGAIQCAMCPIRGAMLENAHVFRKKLTEADKEFIEKEKELR